MLMDKKTKCFRKESRQTAGVNQILYTWQTMEGCWFTSSVNPNLGLSSCKLHSEVFVLVFFWEYSEEVVYLNFSVSHRAFLWFQKCLGFTTTSLQLFVPWTTGRMEAGQFTAILLLAGESQSMSQISLVFESLTPHISDSFPLCTMYAGTRMCKCHSYPIQTFTELV